MRPLGRPRLTVDPDRFALAVLRGFLPDDVTVERTRTATFTQHLPWVQPHAIPGGTSSRMRRHRSTAALPVEVWAADPLAAADLADLVVQAFQDAHDTAHIYSFNGAPVGSLVAFDVTSPFGEVRDAGQLGGVLHWTGQLSLTLRPTAAT